MLFCLVLVLLRCTVAPDLFSLTTYYLLLIERVPILVFASSAFILVHQSYGVRVILHSSSLLVDSFTGLESKIAGKGDVVFLVFGEKLNYNNTVVINMENMCVFVLFVLFVLGGSLF